MKLENIDGDGVMLSVRTTQSALERMRGLLGRPALKVGEVMVIEPCNMVHTVGMRYPIDVVFVDRSGCVLKVSPAVQPLRFRACWGARLVVELASGEAARRGWATGTQLSFLSRTSKRP
jgi:uncharacterized protein